jgi:WD40 repeat protein/predicted Ser/Thr protein kinase
MRTAEANTCPRCGATLGASGHCGPCLFAVTFHADGETAPETDGPAPWTRFAGLDLFEEIGRGGMGVVYRAKQSALDREVAVKVLLRARFAGTEERTRFHREAQAAARLHHPGIVGIIDTGETEGVPWFSMEYLPGRSLEETVREHPMEERQAATVVRTVAEALQHAHDHGVLHRDLKPSNILLDEDGNPRITDFGIARLATAGTQSSAFTRSGQMLGSPGYAAPEQALDGEADAKTDVHGLGALLYHLLTGRPPFQGPTLDAILVQLREDDPIPVRRLVPGTSADLETICLKCLRKLPGNRYATAREVAEDLDRFLTNQPILARPPGWTGRLWRWTRRHPGMAAMLALSALLSGGIVSTALGFARHQARMEHRASLVSEARSLRQTRHAGSRTEALEKLRAAWRIKASPEIRAEATACLTLPEIGNMTRGPEAPPDPGLSGDGRRIARIEGKDIVVRESDGNREIFRRALTNGISEFKLDDHGERIAVNTPGSGDLVLVSIETGRVIATCRHPMRLHSLDWSGELIATACDNRFIHIWDDAGNLKHRLSGHESPFIRVAFRPRSQELASTSADNHIRLWHAARGTEILRREIHHQPHQRLWWSAAGDALHGLSDDGSCETFPISPSPIADVLAPPQEEPHSENLGTADLRADGRLAVVVDENAARLWDFGAGRTILEVPKPVGQWLGARFSPDGSRLWTCGWANPLEERRFEPIDGKPRVTGVRTLSETQGDLIRDTSADGSLLVLSNNATGHFIVVDSVGRTMLRLPHPGTLATAISPDGKWLLTSSYLQPGVKVWSLPDGTHTSTLLNGQSVVRIMALGDRRFLLRTSDSTHVFQSGTWRHERQLDLPTPVNSMACTPDGRLIAVQGDNEIRILSTANLTEVHHLTAPAHAGWLGEGHLVFSPDGSMLLLHTAVGTVVRWNLAKLADTLRQLGLVEGG